LFKYLLPEQAHHLETRTRLLWLRFIESVSWRAVI